MRDCHADLKRVCADRYDAFADVSRPGIQEKGVRGKRPQTLTLTRSVCESDQRNWAISTDLKFNRRFALVLDFYLNQQVRSIFNRDGDWLDNYLGFIVLWDPKDPRSTT